jgi:uncharacterized integral membrane protein (TIGR00698 family)
MNITHPAVLWADTRAAWQPGGLWRARIPGLAVAATLAFVAGGLAAGLGDPWARNPVLVAMLLGLVVGAVFGCPESLQPGLQFTTRFLLRLAIALVGLRITGKLLVDVGIVPIVIATTELLLVFGFVLFAARKLFRLDREFSLLLAAGSAICGAAAILAVAGLTRAKSRDAAIAVTVITLFGTIALFAYPVAFDAGWLPGLDDEWYGVFVGASVYELAQVYGAAYYVSELTLGTATLIKLTKVLMLIPMLLAIRFFLQRKAAPDSSVPMPFPWFIVGFIGVVIFNSTVNLSGPVRLAINQFDVFLLTMVMVALGLNTRAQRLGEGMSAKRLVGIATLTLAFATAAAYGLVRAGIYVQGAAAATSQINPATQAPLGEGARLFRSIGCAKCHVPTLPAGGKELTLYSDLLLHDMGPALDDKIVQGDAEGRDWRTAPLAGLGLRKRYLHDGRAATLRDAIVAHGGEGGIVRNRFLDLREGEQQALYRFLDGL